MLLKTAIERRSAKNQNYIYKKRYKKSIKKMKNI